MAQVREIFTSYTVSSAKQKILKLLGLSAAYREACRPESSKNSENCHGRRRNRGPHTGRWEEGGRKPHLATTEHNCVVFVRSPAGTAVFRRLSHSVQETDVVRYQLCAQIQTGLNFRSELPHRRCVCGKGLRSMRECERPSAVGRSVGRPFKEGRRLLTS